MARCKVLVGWIVWMLVLAGCRPQNAGMELPSGILTAAPVWTYRTGEAITSTPGQGLGSVYVRTERSVIALGANSGTERWHAESFSETPLSLPPSIVDGVVIVPESGSRIAAFDPETGRLLWRTGVTTVSGLYSPRIDALGSAGGLVIVGRHDLSLTAYSAASGHVVWQHSFSNRATQYLASDGEVVYLAMADVLSAYDALSGAVLWEHQFDGYIGPVAMNGTVLYLMDQTAPSLVALDTESQQVLWEAPFQEIRPFEVSCLVEATGRILIAERKVIAVSASDGKVEWSSIQTGPLECPVTLGRNLYVRNHESTLYAFDMTSGVQTGSLPVESNTPMKNEPNRGPIVNNGLLITPTGSREIIALVP